MIPASGLEQRVNWAFWLAAASAAAAGVAPLAIGGTSSRLASSIIPFGIAALALAACALFHAQGRGVTAVLYFLAGLALVYGMLAMFALPLELAVLGTCPAQPAPCTSGLGRPLTLSENTTMGFATAFAVAGLLVGFFGLVLVYRRQAPQPFTPPVRRIPPMGAAPVAPVAVAAATPEKEQGGEAEAQATGSTTAVLEADGEGSAEEEPELPPHAEEPELPPHEEEPELPPHIDASESGDDGPQDRSTPPST